jgi:hypothetical protein
LGKYDCPKSANGNYDPSIIVPPFNLVPVASPTSAAAGTAAAEVSLDHRFGFINRQGSTVDL